MTVPDSAELGAAREWKLAELLSNRRWVRRADPFPHLVAYDVFTPAFYRELEADFRRHQDFARNMPGYDATAAHLTEPRGEALDVFASREWRDMIENVSGVRCTGDLHVTLHHHEIGSKTGWPHHDLNPGWFEDPEPGPAELRLSSPTERISYSHGPRAEGVTGHQVIRAVSILFYLNNGQWQPGDGGETALYASSSDSALTGPAATIAPINNSMVVFETSPFSWHSFLSNTRQTRDSVVMWLHRTRQDVLDRWGETRIAHWE